LKTSFSRIHSSVYFLKRSRYKKNRSRHPLLNDSCSGSSLPPLKLAEPAVLKPPASGRGRPRPATSRSWRASGPSFSLRSPPMPSSPRSSSSLATTATARSAGAQGPGLPCRAPRAAPGAPPRLPLRQPRLRLHLDRVRFIVQMMSRHA
jgi:hypothetical protein